MNNLPTPARATILRFFSGKDAIHMFELGTVLPSFLVPPRLRLDMPVGTVTAPGNPVIVASKVDSPTAVAQRPNQFLSGPPPKLGKVSPITVGSGLLATAAAPVVRSAPTSSKTGRISPLGSLCVAGLLETKRYRLHPSRGSAGDRPSSTGRASPSNPDVQNCTLSSAHPMAPLGTGTATHTRCRQGFPTMPSNR